MAVQRSLLNDEETVEAAKKNTTKHGYRIDEIKSMLQKAIRAGDEERAAFAAYEMMESGLSWQLWRRLKVIAAEDVGGMMAPVFIGQMIWVAKDTYGEATMIAMRAAIELARYVRFYGGDRTADDMRCVFDERFEEGWQGLPILDIDKDEHTKAGRALGRGDGFFWRESSKLVKESPTYEKKWIEEMRKRYEGKK